MIRALIVVVGLLAALGGMTEGTPPVMAQCATINCQISATDSQRAISTTYTIGQSSNDDCAMRIVAGGSAFYTITAGAASGYSCPGGQYRFTVTNVDTGAGKTMSISGLTNGGFNDSGCGFGNLCPGQTIEYASIGGAWSIIKYPGAWQIPAGVTLYASTSGSDTNDCLTSGTACTLSGTCINHRAALDSFPGVVTIQLVDGTYTGTSGTALCQIEGNDGRQTTSLTFIQGNCGIPGNVSLTTPTNGTAIFTKDLGETEVSCMTVTGGNGSTGISGAQFSVVDQLSNWNFGAFGTNSVHIQISQSASFNVGDNYTISGAAAFHIVVTGNANLSVQGNVTTVTIPSALAFTSFMQNQGGYISWGSSALFTGSGFSATTGNKYSNYSLRFGTGAGGCLYTNGVDPNTFFPGSVSVPFPVASCGDFPIGTTVSVLYNSVGCNANNEGVMYAVTDSTVATWGQQILAGDGGGTNHVLAYCDGIAGGGALTVAGK